MTNRQRKLAQRNNVLDKQYGQFVSQLIRLKYSQSDVEAILNNYMEDPTNENYMMDFKNLQAYRAECKKQAKLEVYGEE